MSINDIEFKDVEFRDIKLGDTESDDTKPKKLERDREKTERLIADRDCYQAECSLCENFEEIHNNWCTNCDVSKRLLETLEQLKARNI